MRTFIAIGIPEDIKQRMAEIQGALKATGVEASWPRAEGIHLTLRFLGDIQESEADNLMAALTRAVEGKGPFHLEIRGAGAFPNSRSARVVWIGVNGDLEKLTRVQAAVEEAVVRLGMEREDRPFKPHLTIGRIKYIRSREHWLAALEKIRDIQLPGFEVNAISLMKSELKRTGAVYTEIGRIELK